MHLLTFYGPHVVYANAFSDEWKILKIIELVVNCSANIPFEDDVLTTLVAILDFIQQQQISKPENLISLPVLVFSPNYKRLAC